MYTVALNWQMGASRVALDRRKPDITVLRQSFAKAYLNHASLRYPSYKQAHTPTLPQT